MRDEDKSRESLIAELTDLREQIAQAESSRAEAKQAEAVLREAEERYRAFVSNSSEAIWRFDAEHPISVLLTEDEQIELFFRYGYLAECNDTMARMAGLDRAEQLLGARLENLLAPSDARTIEHLRSFIQSGYRLREDETCAVGRGGDIRFIATSLIGFVENNFLMHAWGVARDVTAHKRAENDLRKAREELEQRVEERTLELRMANEALKSEVGERKRVEESARKFEFIANASRDLMTLIERDYTYEAVNEAYCRAHQKGREDFVQRTVGEIWGWERFHSLIKPQLDQCFAGREVHDENWFAFPGQEERCYQITYYPYLKDVGQVSHAVVVTRDITEQKLTEHALRESKDYLDRIINSISDPIFVKDREHRLVLVNDAECALAGRARAELLDRTDYDFFPKAQVDVFWEKDEVVFETGTENINEEEITDSQGITRTIVTKKNLYTDHMGNQFIVGIVRDISDRKKAEEALKESEERLRLALEMTGLGTWDCDVMSGKMVCSHRCKTILGLMAHEEVDFNKLLAIVHPEDRHSLHGLVLQAMEPGGDGEFHCEYRIIRSDGTMRLLDSNGRTFFDEMDGMRKAVRIIGTVADITDRRQAEESLRQRAEELEKLMEVTPVGILVASDPECRHVVGNLAANKFLGVSREENSPAPPSVRESGQRQLFSRSGQDLASEDLPMRYAALHGVDVRDAEVEMVSSDGSLRTFLGNASPLRNESGEVRGCVGAFIDITERKRAEEAILNSQKQLRFLSSRLLETQEEERQRIARELHDSIGQSLVAMKFRLENALRAVNRVKAEDLCGSLESIIPMIQNVMTEARRIYMGLRPSTLDDLGIVATLSWFCRSFQTTYPAIHIGSSICLDEDEIPKPLNIVIFRIVQEALNNVAKHSKGEVALLSLKKRENFIELVIEDNGQGFDLDSVLSRDGHERGLGLTGMRERTELSGGSFNIESVVGRGTTVRASWAVQKGPDDFPKVMAQ